MIELVYSLESIDEVVDLLYDQMDRCAVFTFDGPLGAGKTTLIKKLLKKCGVEEVVLSPTFTYVALYSNSKGQVFYHFDLYRLGRLEEFMHAGFNEYLYVPNSWSFIEWPDIIKPLLTHEVCQIQIDYHGESERHFTLR